eukprot:6068000-Prymnesium_polylepis.1
MERTWRRRGHVAGNTWRLTLGEILSFDLAGGSMVKNYERNLGASATKLCPKATPDRATTVQDAWAHVSWKGS